MENPFIVENKNIEQKLSAKEYLMKELMEDISIFSELAQKAIRKLVGGDNNLMDDEATALKNERDEWWMEKYGFPYKQKQARNEVLMRKYAPPEEKAKAIELQRSLLEALKNDDQEKVKELQDVYFREYPDQLEGVTILFEMLPFLRLSAKVSKESKDYSTEKENFEYLTQYQFLLTDFILFNSKDKEFMKNFWDIWATIAKNDGVLREFNILRRGILSQVSVFKIFEALGFTPKLSHPKEDAFEAIDMWSGSGEAVQIKGTPNDDAAVLIETDEISFPGVDINDGGELKHLNSYMQNQAQKFRAKLSRYNKFTKQDVKGYFVVIPYSKFDHVTGEPDREFVNRVREELTI
ncbi:MAG: hypothetical protein P1P90_04435 [Patescibacteria group bacterium]|nr:hypothetical protein [Patescibacteria group bacterium]